MAHQPLRTLVTVADAAEYLGVTDRTIRNYIARGQLRAHRLAGRAVRIDVADLDAMLRQIPTVAAE
jgi:excisionase family DNA binding protein